MLSISYNKDGKVEQSLSAYNPSTEVKDFATLCRVDYENGDEILNRSFPEFNNRSVIQRMDEDQKAWLSWTPEPSGDPEESWRWNGVRPITRNKVISTAAHLTSQLLFPNIFAQNDNDEEDRDMAYVMKDLIEYNVRHSDYELTFLYGVISGLVNPVTYWEVGYTEAYQDIIEGTNSNFKKREVVDDILSGFQHNLHNSNEILISNPYQFDLQKEKCLIKKRRISYDEAEGLYGSHENWGHVHGGLQAVMAEDGLYYDVPDINGDLVEELTYYYRRNDCQCVFVNGIYLGTSNVKYNPFVHRTNKNKPKYPFVKFGAEPIDAKRFWAYKSLVAKMSNDQESIDREWQMYHDASFLATFNPLITTGAGKIDKSVVVPATVTEIGKDAKITPLQISNPVAAQNVLREVEKSLSETSQDSQMAGISSDPKKTARESILLQQNAETNLGVMGKMIGSMVKNIGDLTIDDIIRYQTVGEMTELLGGIPKMKFRTFILENKVKDGKNISEHIRFTDRFAGRKFSKKEKDMEELRMYQENGEDKSVYEINPLLFSRLNFLTTVDYEQLMKRNTAFERAYKLEIFDRAIANAEILGLDAQAIGRDFLLEPLVKGDASKYFIKNEGVLGGILPQGGEVPTKGRLPSRLVESVAKESVGMLQ